MPAHKQPKAFFTTIALIFGLLFGVLLPPGHVPDEINHFYRTYQISQGVWQGKTIDKRLGGYIPTGVVQFFEPFRKLRYQYNQTVNVTDFKIAYNAASETDPIFQDFPNTAIYSPLAYAPQAIAVKFFNTIGLRPFYIFYLTRIVGLLCWIGLIRLALNWIPFGKWLLAILALMPSSLFINCGITADLLINGISFALIALLLKLSTSTKPLKKSIWILPFLFASFLSFSKVVYFPIFLLVFLIPAEKFSNLFSFSAMRNKALYISSSLIVNSFIIGLVFFNSRDTYIPYDTYNPVFREGQQINESANPSQQLDYVLAQPVTFAKTLLISYVDSGKATTAHYFGKFGWEKNYLPMWLILLLISSSLALGLTTKKRLSLFTHLLLLGVGILMMIGFAALIFLQWSPVGSKRILGLAGRYMFPIFPLFYLALPSFFTKHYKYTLFFAQASLLCSLVISVYYLIHRYYL